MENEDARKEYLVFPPSKSQCPGSSQKGRKIPLKGNGRRIDYMLYSDEGLQPDWKLVRGGVASLVQGRETRPTPSRLPVCVHIRLKPQLSDAPWCLDVVVVARSSNIVQRPAGGQNTRGQRAQAAFF